jgi:PAS domain-containing protein
MPGPVYIKDQDSKILFVNRYMRDQAPKPKLDEWQGLSNVDLFNKERAIKLTEEDQLVLKEGPIDRIQERLLDGKKRTYRTHKFPIIREGRAPLIGGFSIDITEQVEAEKQLFGCQTLWRTILIICIKESCPVLNCFLRAKN